MPENAIGKILIVDDEVELKNALVEALASQSFEARGFTSGREALEALRQEEFDLLLSDLMMPEIDGIELVKAALEIDPNLVAVIMTGQGTIQTAVDAMKAGSFDYVLKPFRLQSVMPVLNRALNTRRLRLDNLQLRETVAIYEMSQTIALTLDFQTIVDKLADAVLQQTDADEVSILLPQNDEELYVAAVRGDGRHHLLGERVPLDQSISGWVTRERDSLMLNGEVKDERFRPVYPHPEIRSAIVMPMQVANKLVGTININAVSRLRPFTPGQVKALMILASTAAAALESASLYHHLRQAEENYRSIFENAVEGIFQSTPDHSFLKANPSLARILGYESPQEVVDAYANKTLRLYVDPAKANEVSEILEQAGLVNGFEFEAFRRDGEKIWLSMNMRLVCDEDGAPIYREGSIEDITERKKAEEEQRRLDAEIRAQRERLNTIVATVPGVVFEYSGQVGTVEHHTDFVSDYIQTMVGYSPTEWASKPGFWLTVVHPEDRERVKREMASLFSECRNGQLEFRWIARSGRVVWVRAQTIIVNDAEGKPSGIRGVVTDITEEKQVAELQGRRETHALFRAEVSAALTISSTSLRDVLELCARAIVDHLGAALACIWTQNRDENALELQATAGLVLNDEELVESLGKGTIGNIAKTRTPHVTNELTGDVDFREQQEWIRQQGLISFAGFPLLVEDRLLGVMAMFSRDVLAEDTHEALASVADLISQTVERKRAAEALRESEERYRYLVENANDIIYSHDLQGNFTSVNKAGERITGYTIEESLKLSLADLVAPDSLPRSLEMISTKLAGERATAYEMDLIAKDGHRLTVEANTKLVLKDEVPVGVQGIARDVTERKSLEEQLRQSQKMEAIGRLAGGVAHDFNNLLTAINGYSTLALQRLNDDHPLRGYLEEIKKAGERAANLTRQLLAFGRKQILQPLALNLNEIVADMNKMLRRLIGEHIELIAKLAPDLEKTKADPGQIEQVLVNLVVNASDAMSHGGTLTIETANAELDAEYVGKHIGAHTGSYVMLAVSDTGIGINEETRRHIFEPFFTTKEKGKGTGLGLSTVYGIVNQSGGHVWVYSEPGRGSTFKIYLPQIDREIRKAAVEEEAKALGGLETILLVEDEEVVRGLTRKILEQVGYQVLEARGGEEALRFCHEHLEPIDLLLTDVVMPNASGREVAQQVKSLHPEVRVLFMSGYTDEAIVHHGVLDSGVEFIQKPFTPNALAMKVREVIEAENGGSL